MPYEVRQKTTFLPRTANSSLKPFPISHFSIILKMRALVYTGGTIVPEYIIEHPKADDLTVAADSGYNNAKKLGDKVQVLVGDFDSLGERNIPDGPELVRLKPEKDQTDTQVAVEVALERGATEIVIIGGLSGRFDHALSNLAILEDLNLRGFYAILTDGVSRIRYVRSSSALIAHSFFRYISVLAADEKVRGVTIEGCKYPLKNAVIRRRFQFAVSNEIEGNCALISVKKGGIFIIESRDPV